jgi:hypothetical protein
MNTPDHPSRLAAVLRPGRIALALALATGSVALAACGDDGGGTIPPTNADQMIQQVDQIEAALEQGECTSAQTDVSQLEGAIFTLPKEVGVQTKEDLRDLATNLGNLVASQCEEAPEAPETTTPPEGTTGADGSVPSDDDSGGSEG